MFESQPIPASRPDGRLARRRPQDRRTREGSRQWGETLEQRLLLSGISFDAPRMFETSGAPDCLVTGDFNGDGRADLVAVSSKKVSVLRNGADGSFVSGFDYIEGGDFGWATSADFDDDGRPDLAVARWGGTVSVLRSNGDGTFTPAGNYSAGSRSSGLTSADFDGDGMADLVTSNSVDNLVCVFRNNGDGTFAPKVDYAAGPIPYSVVCVDFNGDGRSDLAVRNHSNGSFSDGSVSVLLNAGNGSFGLPRGYGTSPNPVSLTTGDFDGDGRHDLAVACYGNLKKLNVLRNNGDGTFAPKVEYTTGENSLGAASGDFNGDGRVDLALANSSTSTSPSAGTLSVLLNNGNGTFAPKVNYDTGSPARALVTGDLDGDGRLDVAVAELRSLTQTGGVDVLLNKGGGVFAARVDFTTNYNPNAIVTDDFDGDGWPDLATANMRAIGSVSVLLNRGHGTFVPRVDYTNWTEAIAITSADFDGDGRPDLATANPNSGGVSVLRNTGGGAFAPNVDYGSKKDAGSITAADFDGDGKPDLVFGGAQNGGLYVLRNNGNGTFAPPVAYPVLFNPTSITSTDVDADGRIDLVVSEGNAVHVFRNAGGGNFTAGVKYNAGSGSQWVTAADFDGDGRPDLAVANYNSADPRGGTVSLLRNNGDGTFAPKVAYAAGTYPRSVVAADVDGDGRRDLIVGNQSLLNTEQFPPTGTLSVLRNRGNGTFEAKANYIVGIGSSSVAAADFDGDGRVDLVTSEFRGYGSGSHVSVLRNITGPLPLALPATFAGTPNAVTLTFSKDVAASLAASDLVITPLGDGGPTISPGSVSFDPLTKTAKFLFASPLPDGNYRATIRTADVADAAGKTLPGDFAADFFTLAGDANADRTVNFADLLALAKNYGKPGTWSQGDFNGDGKIDFADLLTLAKSYNKSLAAPPAPSAVAAAPTPASVLRDEAASRPVFSTTPVAKPAPVPAKSKIASPPASR